MRPNPAVKAGGEDKDEAPDLLWAGHKGPMSGPKAPALGSSLVSTIATSALGGVVGGSAAAVLVVGITETIKALLAVVSRQHTWVLILVPLLGLTLSVLILHGFGLSEEQSSQRPQWAAAWRTFPPHAIRSDLTGDIVESAGREERFPWRLAPIRLLAIYATVGLGAAMGTEKPAAYFGVATGVALRRSLVAPPSAARSGGGRRGRRCSVDGNSPRWHCIHP